MPVVGANTMTFEQVSAVLAEIVSQASGKTVLAPVDTSQFISVAQTALLSGFDPMMNAISQVLSRTIFSTRPYYSKFRGLMADSIRYGNHVRKLQVADGEVENNDEWDACKSPLKDMYDAPCPKILQTNFYGGATYQRSMKILRSQLNSAFRGPDEFARFIAMIMTNAQNQLEQVRENTARAALGNFINGKVLGDPTNVVHALTEYNNLTGAGLTPTSVYAPENFPDFVRWLYARINQISDMLTNRSYKYHVNITGKEIQRHTPKERQKVYLTAQFINLVDALVRTVNYDNSFMRMADFEKVGFWQSIDTPESVSNSPVYMLPNGELTKGADTTTNNIIGVVFDEEAIGYTEIDRAAEVTPYNPQYRITVMYWHFTERYWNDYTENGVVILMD